MAFSRGHRGTPLPAAGPVPGAAVAGGSRAVSAPPLACDEYTPGGRGRQEQGGGAGGGGSGEGRDQRGEDERGQGWMSPRGQCGTDGNKRTRDEEESGGNMKDSVQGGDRDGQRWEMKAQRQEGREQGGVEG